MGWWTEVFGEDHEDKRRRTTMTTKRPGKKEEDGEEETDRVENGDDHPRQKLTTDMRRKMKLRKKKTLPVYIMNPVRDDGRNVYSQKQRKRGLRPQKFFYV
jgi:hypothetical protein